MSDMFANKEKLKRFFVIGAIFLIIALIMWLIPAIYIGNISGQIDLMEMKGTQTEAEQHMLNALEYSKVWWLTIQTTVFNPTATILLAIGIVIILYGLLVRFT